MSLIEKYQSTISYISTIDVTDCKNYDIKYIGYGCHMYQNENDKFQIDESLNMMVYFTPKKEDGSYTQFVFGYTDRPFHPTSIYEIDGTEKIINKEQYMN